MKKNGEPELKPGLRFPEFRDAVGWKQNRLSEIASFFKGKGISKSDISANGRRPCIRYGELYTRYGEVIDDVYSRTDVADTDLFFSKANDVVIPGSGETKLDIAKASCVIHDDVALGGDLNIIRTRHKGIFLSYYLNVKRLDIAKIAQGDTVAHLYPSQLKKLAIAIPDELEQQKIADCLTSVDELIVAQARKVDALKIHKKGLMQQLFPREGETQPRLRFPEFRDGPLWEKNMLGDLLQITSSKRVHESDWVDNGVPFYRAREIVALHNLEPISPLFISEDLYSYNAQKSGEIFPGDLLVTGVGSIGVPYAVQNKDCFYFKDGNIIWLKNRDTKLLGQFLYLLYESQYVQSQIKTMAGVGTVGTYTIDNAKKTSVMFPANQEEQKKVADCLTSVDDLIAAQVRKVDALKTHKKGLMQQLFPTPEVNI